MATSADCACAVSSRLSLRRPGSIKDLIVVLRYCVRRSSTEGLLNRDVLNTVVAVSISATPSHHEGFLMCGIVAVASFSDRDWTDTAKAMSDAISHRGPDDSGLAALPEDGVTLAMRRLSVIDIDGGHQPMWDAGRRICLVFNGEIYNCAELRAQLVAAGYHFRSDHSDTEVLIHGYRHWGVGLLPKLNGMFAIALWDRDRHELVLARDRAGEKPLYLARLPGGGFAVASEIKALLCHPDVKREVDPVGLEQFLSFGYAIGPRTMLRGIEKLTAGNYAVVSSNGIDVQPFWNSSFEKRNWSEDDAIGRFDELLRQSVNLRMLADVPLGLFLSGGLDSTTIAYYMRETGNAVQSFSIAFEDSRFDETRYAQMAAQHLGIDHHVEMLSQDRLVELIPQVTEMLDEPMGDPAIFPNYLLSTFTRRHVKVALGGDGSDELLMGYRDFLTLRAAHFVDALPRRVRRPIGERIVSMRGRRASYIGATLRETPEHRALSLIGQFRGRSRWILSNDVRQQLPASVFTEVDEAFASVTRGAASWADRSIAAYMRGYLQEDILVKVDRSSMAASLEVRAPFLDPDLIDFLASVSPSLKLRRTTRKYLLKKLMRGRIPDEIIDRRKHGLGVPLDAWFRGALRPLAVERLSPDRVRQVGLLDPDAVNRLLQGHLEGREERGDQLWLLLQLDLWWERWLGG
ncbi:asparagine synthase (glutamine-hydrolyzing) [Mycolicibacterium sp. Dal123E01]|uniref:asparagine synthase (glutamine-hydrolyzing) n=1 Tax=Mycolicibacterium sp. Dal123E01 TaxID=3457578 RepID=UPI00403ED851